MRRHMATVLGLALLSVLCLTAPVTTATAESPSPQAAEPTVLKMGTVKDFDTLNPLGTVSSMGFWVAWNGYECLTWYDRDYNVVPVLAESWEFGDDQRTITYALREGVTWSDGEPFTSADVEFTLRLVLDEPIYNWLGEVDWIDTIETPDPLTVVITSKEPSIKALNMNCPILPEHVWSAVPKKDLLTYESFPMVTTGPFVVTEAERKKLVRMVRNDTYWGKKPAIDEAWWLIYTS